MRFITEFELDIPFSNKEADKCKSTMGFHIGGLIANSFDWNSAPFLSMIGPHRNKWSLEIEAFPMDKWVEFKRRIATLVMNNCDELSEDVIKLLKELESCGKSELLTEPDYRGPGSHCKACEDEAAGIKHIKAQKHTCKK